MQVKRCILSRIEKFLKSREYLAVVGPRQCGKTVLLGMIKQYLKKELKVKENNIALITFEDRKLLRQFESEPIEFVKSYIDKRGTGLFYLLIDEFQYAKEGGQKLKFVYDTVKNFKAIITGSSSLEIRAKTGKYMVGRMLSFNMYPFNFSEYLLSKSRRHLNIYEKKSRDIVKFIFKGKKPLYKNKEDAFYSEMIDFYKDYVVWGGYPAVVIEKNKEKKQKLQSEINSGYIMKDIKGLLALATENELESLITQLAIRPGNLINYTNLCADTALDYRNLKKHLRILNETFVCDELRPFYKNKRKELSKNPKIYFIDTGFRNNVLDDFNDPDMRTDGGALVENVVYRRLKELAGGRIKINYWRTKPGAEVDFILKVDGKPAPVEVKYSCFKGNKVSRSFMSFVQHYKPSTGLILTKNYFGISKKGKTNILFAPVYYL